MNVNREAAYTMIAALSASPEGRELVENLERMRYYHWDGNTYNIGYGASLAIAWGVDDGAYYVNGTILLPGKRDKLYYKSAAWKGENIDAALYWYPGADTYTIIPRVLGEWAAELIISCSDIPPYIPEECRGVACSVDGMEGMVVTAPGGFTVPGLTPDKWARRKAFQSHYKRDDFPSIVDPGYMQGCEVIYGIEIGWVDNLIYGTCGGLKTKTPGQLLDREDEFDFRPAKVLQAACQVLSGYRKWDYFDTCGDLQCARHLVTGDFTPHDLSDEGVVSLQEAAV